MTNLKTTFGNRFSRLSVRLSIAALLILLTLNVHAIPLLTVNGAGDSGYIINSNQAAAVSFVLTENFNDVTIRADLTGVNAQGGVFLMSELGTNAGFGDIVAAVDFSSLVFSGSNTLLFSGLDLLTGNYAILVASDQSAPNSTVIWNGSSAANVVAASGITLGIDFFSSSTAAFPPASSFDTISDRSAHFSISRTVTQVLEPGSGLLFILGLAGFVLRHSRCKTNLPHYLQNRV